MQKAAKNRHLGKKNVRVPGRLAYRSSKMKKTNIFRTLKKIWESSLESCIQFKMYFRVLGIPI